MHASCAKRFVESCVCPLFIELKGVKLSHSFYHKILAFIVELAQGFLVSLLFLCVS